MLLTIQHKISVSTSLTILTPLINYPNKSFKVKNPPQKLKRSIQPIRFMEQETSFLVNWLLIHYKPKLNNNASKISPKSPTNHLIKINNPKIHKKHQVKRKRHNHHLPQTSKLSFQYNHSIKLFNMLTVFLSIITPWHRMQSIFSKGIFSHRIYLELMWEGK